MLLSLRNIDLRLGGPVLLEKAELTLEAGERLALLGRNGAGKTSLLRLIAGDLLPDAGERRLQSGTRVALLPQEIPTQLAGSVAEVAQGSIGEAATADHTVGGASWQVERWLTEMGVDPEADFAALSGGMKRRVLLARALACEPDLLLLDEPTNHLDPVQIEWLEDLLLQRFKGCLLFISHDRRFIRRLASGILHLDRGKLTRWPGDLDRYLDGREAALAVEERHSALFDKHLAQEESWIRQGVKARRTRNEGRVRALEALRQQRTQRRAQTGQARIELETASPSGRLVAELDGISHGFTDQRPLLRDFSTTLLRGDKVGIVGPNGCGKTTLLRILLGELEPQHGRIRHGTRLEVAYFDQLRADLNDSERPVDVVGGGKDTVTVNGRSRHVIGYLQDFLFSPEQARAPIAKLSGGERNRLLLAQLFARPANLLVLDEPTNDLDVETLELLEARLVAYDGTLLAVSHDREFLDRVVGSCIVFEGNGQVEEYVGGYSDAMRQSQAGRAGRTTPGSTPPSKAAATTQPAAIPAAPKRKLSYKDERERQELPKRIETLEAAQAALTARMADPAFYRRDPTDIAADTQALKELETELAGVYARWESLESQAAG